MRTICFPTVYVCVCVCMCVCACVCTFTVVTVRTHTHGSRHFLPSTLCLSFSYFVSPPPQTTPDYQPSSAVSFLFFYFIIFCFQCLFSGCPWNCKINRGVFTLHPSAPVDTHGYPSCPSRYRQLTHAHTLSLSLSLSPPPHLILFLLLPGY